MFYNIALRTGIALNFIAIISNMLICFINDESRWNGQMKTISSKCRNKWGICNCGSGHLRTSSLLDANIFQWMDHCFCGHVVFKTLEKR